MSKVKRTWLGILAFLPLIITTIFLVFVFFFYFKIIFGTINGTLAYSDGSEFIYFLVIMIIVGTLFNIVMYTALIIFTICIVKNKKIGDTAKILYLIGMYFLYTITPIVYFFIEVFGKKEKLEEE